ncbi:Patatin [Halorhabdus utahensis DSM 12940]|uniref:Patatin n=1 Tax=Halorhabdus utahensis (strain DSM 12940 / JCM 11049 / AX-2) TaxID=519442 RepID=C7NUE2_HALUD|nr:patatin-like phospholipase family protein [Halorhabdus utahensis]ACV11039.1 Patatin [Halorhabdus utahensis DSM 12940]
MSETTNVAIACQGGGSHTAFTAGVLEELLRECDWDEEFELVGISGTSGGAFNALAVWYGLVTEGPDRAADLVTSIWDDLAADEYGDRLLNSWLTSLNRLGDSGWPLPRISPYQVPGKEIGKERIREVLETHIDFDAIPVFCRHETPELVVGTVNVNAGVFETFVDEDVTVEAVLASAAVPNVFEAVEIHGHYHWDGLFSQNPPVRDMMHQPPERKPEELWIIQINPQELEGEPTTLEEIADRRNELSGNISLNQELGFVEQINEWVAEGKLPTEEFAQTEIHRIEMGRDYHCSTKLDRDPEFIAELMDLGRSQCGAFLDER